LREAILKPLFQGILPLGLVSMEADFDKAEFVGFNSLGAQDKSSLKEHQLTLR